MSFDAVVAADRTNSFPAVQSAILAFWQAHPDKSFYDVELLLRQHNCQAHLLARQDTHANGRIHPIGKGTWINAHRLRQRTKIVDLRHNMKPTSHFLWVTTKSGAELAAEMMAESKSYDENLEKLKDTGVQCVDRDGIDAVIGKLENAESCSKCQRARPSPVTFRFCERCDSVKYCSTSCQKEDWKFHQKHCAHLRKQAQVAEKNGLSKKDRDNVAQLSDYGARTAEARKKFEDVDHCCRAGYSAFGLGEDQIMVHRQIRHGGGLQPVLVCESCMARMAVTNTERANKVHCRSL